MTRLNVSNCLWYLFAAVYSALFLAGCASQKPNVDYLPGVDFAAYKTYDWVPSTADPKESQRAKNPLVDARIIDAVDKSLAAEGLTKSGGSPDLLVNYHVAVSAQEQAQPRGSIGIGGSRYGGGPSVGFSVSVPVGGSRTHQEGTLVVDLLDAKTNKLVWQGSASRRVRQDIDPERFTALINEVVAEIFANYPPAK